MISVRTVLAAAIFAFAAFAPAAAELATRSSDAAGVRVVVAPKALGADATAWEFEVTMDTHTRPLTEDLAQAAVMVDDAGRRYRPLAWQGDAPGGHHRKGILRFPAPTATPRAIELQMTGVGGVPSRSFRWQLN